VALVPPEGALLLPVTLLSVPAGEHAHALSRHKVIDNRKPAAVFRRFMAQPRLRAQSQVYGGQNHARPLVFSAI
jgi:hypothetical protein